MIERKTDKYEEKRVLQYLPIAYKGVFVSINPRKAPCAASAITMGGAPKALKLRKFSAGTLIGESYSMINLM